MGSKGNVLVFNDEAHHAYRIRNAREDDDEDTEDEGADDDVDDYFVREATVWVDGLDKIHKHRGIDLSVDVYHHAVLTLSHALATLRTRCFHG